MYEDGTVGEIFLTDIGKEGYVVFPGQLTPGGGFQGGVVLAAGPVAILLAGRYLSMKGVAPKLLNELAHAGGAASYALIGLGGLIFAGVYLKNPMPLGIPGHLLSSGMMPLNSIAVGLEVTGAFLLTWTEFLDQTTFGPSEAAG
jgi:multicomponent Na+:H+ antiporter subunit B